MCCWILCSRRTDRTGSRARVQPRAHRAVQPPPRPRLVAAAGGLRLRGALHRQRPGTSWRAAAPVTPFHFGDELPGGIVVHEVGAICPDETALHIPAHRALACADGVVRWPGVDGLTFVPDWLMDEPEQTKEGLRAAYRASAGAGLRPAAACARRARGRTGPSRRCGRSSTAPADGGAGSMTRSAHASRPRAPGHSPPTLAALAVALTGCAQSSNTTSDRSGRAPLRRPLRRRRRRPRRPPRPRPPPPTTASATTPGVGTASGPLTATPASGSPQSVIHFAFVAPDTGTVQGPTRCRRR